MKKKAMILVLVVLALVFTVPASAAFTTVEGKAVNVITSGRVDILLQETTASGGSFPSSGISGVLPGAEYSKIVSVTNIGPQEAWIRLKVDSAITLADGKEGDSSVMELDIDRTNWREKNGYYYYLHPLAPGETTLTPLFTTVRFDPRMGNQYQGSTAAILVTALATQTKNNGATVWEANGWPADRQD